MPRVPLPFARPKPIIGVVHLLPLPGSPGWGGDFDEVLRRAREDAHALVDGGCDGVIVENMGDAPHFPTTVPPVTVAAMTRAVAAVQDLVGHLAPVGVNVLRNDATAALSIAAATGARFIRVNVHQGVMVGTEGVLEGKAAETLRLRAALEAEVAILADVLVKHASPLGATDMLEDLRFEREPHATR